MHALRRALCNRLLPRCRRCLGRRHLARHGRGLASCLLGGLRLGRGHRLTPRLLAPRCHIRHCRRSCGNDTTRSELGKLRLKHRHTLRERIERDLALGTGDAREGQLENQPLVGGGAHLARRITQHRHGARNAINRAKRARLVTKARERIALCRHHARTLPDRSHHVGVTQVGRQLARELQQVTARLRQGRHLGKQPRDVSGGQGQRDLRKRGGRYLAQHVLGRVKGDGASRIGGKALKVRQGIAHAAARVEHHQLERLTVIAEPLALTDVDEASEQLVVADGAEVEALHARKDGLENLLRVSGAHHEDDVLGRLFQRLEQRVERRWGQHVDLVDDIDLVVATNRRVAHTIDDLLAHIVHAGVGGGVELVHVRMLARGDELAVFAGAIGKVSSSLLAEERLCKQASHRGLARSARSAEQVRMAGASLKHGTAQRCHHVLLAHNVVKRLGTILPVERFHGVVPPVLRIARARS